MLMEIASADYGGGAEDLVVSLRQIRHTGKVPVPMDGSLVEVLELIRWSEPDYPNWQPGGTGIRGHTMRAFSCAILLRAGADPEYEDRSPGENQTVAQLVARSLVLGNDVQEAAARFLSWRTAWIRSSEELPFFAFALLVLGVTLPDNTFSEESLASLADCLVAEESRVRALPEVCPPGHGQLWLLGLTYFDLRHHVWRSLAAHMCAEAKRVHSEIVRTKLENVAQRMAGSE